MHSYCFFSSFFYKKRIFYISSLLFCNILCCYCKKELLYLVAELQKLKASSVTNSCWEKKCSTLELSSIIVEFIYSLPFLRFKAHVVYTISRRFFYIHTMKYQILHHYLPQQHMLQSFNGEIIEIQGCRLQKVATKDVFKPYYTDFSKIF